MKEIIRFVLAGSAATATDFLVYVVLCQKLPYSIAKGLSFMCGGIVAYTLNKSWTFKHDQRAVGGPGRFMILNCCALGVNLASHHQVLRLWPSAMFLSFFIATAVTSVVTFIGCKWWVFREAF